MLSSITPVILTYNEAPNIERTLAALSWAADIVVVDSFSEDETPAMLRAHPNVRVFQRPFDSHADQWNFAIGATGISTPWILSLDADYVLTESFVEELGRLAPAPESAGYEASFQYCIYGHPLRGSVYPSVIVLFRRGMGEYRQDGHTQRLSVRGAVGRLDNRIRHDDRKPLSRWLAMQDRYMALEALKISTSPAGALSFADKLRKTIVLAPPLVLLHVLFARGAILDGKAGLLYAFQRMTAELILSLHLLQRFFAAKR